MGAQETPRELSLKEKIYETFDEPATWAFLETFCIIGFTIDFVARMITTPDCKGFWLDFMNMVDFVAIVPFYIELIMSMMIDNAPIPQYLRVIRVVRLARVLRIIKMTKAG